MIKAPVIRFGLAIINLYERSATLWFQDCHSCRNAIIAHFRAIPLPGNGTRLFNNRALAFCAPNF
jgi:hypothetical protein